MFTGVNVHWGRSGAKAPPGALKRAIYSKNFLQDKGSISDKESISDKGSISDKESISDKGSISNKESISNKGSISYIISPKNRPGVTARRTFRCAAHLSLRGAPFVARRRALTYCEGTD